MSSSKFASDSLQGQITSMQSENEKSKTEVKEVLQALEELAMNYDQKLQEVDNKNKENDKLQDDLTSKQVTKFTSLFTLFPFAPQQPLFNYYISRNYIHLA